MNASTFEQTLNRPTFRIWERPHSNVSVQDLTAQERRVAHAFPMLVEARNRGLAMQTARFHQPPTKRVARMMLSQVNALGQTPQSTTPESASVVALAGEMLRHFVTHQMLGAARKFLERSSTVDRPELVPWKRVLAEPRTRHRTDLSMDHSRDYDWLARHRYEYIGQWVALLNGELVANAPSLDALLRELDARALRARALLHKIR